MKSGLKSVVLLGLWLITLAIIQPTVIVKAQEFVTPGFEDNTQSEAIKEEYLEARLVEEVVWGVEDFITMGLLILAFGSLGILIARKFPKNRVITAIILVFLFVWLWAELAVGVFTNWGS